MNNAEATTQRLRESSYALVSSDVIEMPDQRLGFRKGFLVRDPDGHVRRIVERQQESIFSYFLVDFQERLRNESASVQVNSLF